MNKKEIFKICVIFIIVRFLFYISGLLEIFGFFVGVFLYSSLFYIISFPFKKIKNKELKFFDAEIFGKFTYNFLYRISLSIIIICSILGGFAYYENKINPAMMPVYHITNGDKKIVFHAMSHIASPEFYLDVKNDIINLKKQNYILFFEGVKPGKPESYDKFDRALGVKFDKDLYKNMSKLYGLINQDNSMFLGLVNDKDKNIDLSMDEIMEIYEKNPKTNLSTTKEPIDVNVIIQESLDKLNDRELEILRFVNKAIINVIIKSENIQESMASAIGNKTIMDTILGKRNKYLVKAIKEEKEKNIVITYGLLHFKGVFQELQKQDKNRKIEKVDYLQVVR